jgi:hypothetical protein
MKEYIDFLPESLADEIYSVGNDIMRGRYSEKVNFWTNYLWDESIIQDSAVVICIRLPEKFLEDIQNVLSAKGIFDKDTDVPLTHSKSAMIYVWTKDSYIPEHADGIYSKAVTIYLGRNWNYNDGGLFHWQDKNKNTWNVITPDFNKAVVNNAGYNHGVTPVKSKNFRITLQIFLNNIN